MPEFEDFDDYLKDRGLKEQVDLLVERRKQYGGHPLFDVARDRMDTRLGAAVGKDWEPEARAVYNAGVREVMALLPFDMSPFIDQYATREDMLDWALTIMRREPDFTIGKDYMQRWFILPRNDRMNLYLHRTLRDDDDVMHDHPWNNTSLVIRGGYIEHTPGGSIPRKPGDVIERRATDIHRLELVDGQPSISLFMTGPKIREWGFHCPKGWVHWQEFTGGYHAGRSERGAGCGEP